MRLKNLLSFIALLGFTGAHAQFKNILIDSIGDPNEVSIAIDFSNPNNLVAGANLNNVYTSNDAGKTWTNRKMYSKYTVYGDPCIISDYKGNFIIFIYQIIKMVLG